MPALSPVGFTAVYCGRTDCPTHTHRSGDEVAAALRATVRACPHGVLVATGCLAVSLRGDSPEPADDCAQCRARALGSGREVGPLVMVQPCRAQDRTPRGPLVIAGPLHEPADVLELCHWLSHGLPREAPLPRYLHATLG